MKSLYVHIPFCQHICSYCDFSKVFYRKDWVDQYLKALSFEMQDKNINGNYDTLYIGGGTPSALSLQQLQQLFKMLNPLSKKVLEYTIEVNPESMDENKLLLFKQYHVNRLSIGVQSFDDSLLKSIHRYHSSQDAIRLIQSAQKMGFDDINVDLIYGLPHQTLEDVYKDIDLLYQMNISHISIYSLILENHTVLKIEGYKPLDEESDAYWYESINQYLEKKGYIHYEVSNYYLKKPSLHNLVYWHYQDYDGVGLAAHSLKNHHRLENTRNLSRYLKHDYLDEDIELNKDDELFEKIMMGLRLIEGINLNEFNDLYHIDFLKTYKDVIMKYQQLKMLEFNDNYLRTTPLGMNCLNSILIDFLK